MRPRLISSAATPAWRADNRTNKLSSLYRHDVRGEEIEKTLTEKRKRQIDQARGRDLSNVKLAREASQNKRLQDAEMDLLLAGTN